MYHKSLFYLFYINLCWIQISGTDRTIDYFDEEFEDDSSPFTVENRILNGEPVVASEYPFMVLVEGNSDYSFTVSVCGGVILSQLWILTAAHCIEDKDNYKFEVIAGTINFYEFGDTSQSIPVERIIIHPSYDDREAKNDIAMLKLERLLEFNDYVQPIALPLSGYNAEGIGKIMGWGHTTNMGQVSRYLRVGDISVARFKDCKKYFANYIFTHNQICLGFKGNTSACLGDSGGPFLQEIEGKLRVVGITSFTNKDSHCIEGVPSVYTNVASFLDFIEQTMRKCEKDSSRLVPFWDKNGLWLTERATQPPYFSCSIIQDLLHYVKK